MTPENIPLVVFHSRPTMRTPQGQLKELCVPSGQEKGRLGIPKNKREGERCLGFYPRFATRCAKDNWRMKEWQLIDPSRLYWVFIEILKSISFLAVYTNILKNTCCVWLNLRNWGNLYNTKSCDVFGVCATLLLGSLLDIVHLYWEQ